MQLIDEGRINRGFFVLEPQRRTIMAGPWMFIDMAVRIGVQVAILALCLRYLGNAG